MFVLDIETCGVESNAVILSVALVYVDTKTKPDWESLYQNTLFLKLSIRDQIENYERLVDKNTIAWWQKQCDIAKNMSFIPKKSDLTAKEAVQCLRNYVKEQSSTPKTDTIWVRGSIDQICLDSLFNKMGEERLFPFYNYRDVRTFLEFCTETGSRGYSEIDPEQYPGTWNREIVVKHMPQDDICLDALMLLYGK